MNICESVNEELDKSKLLKLIKDVISSIQDNTDLFEITDTDGSITLDSDGNETDRDKLAVEALSDLEDFSGFLNEVAEDEKYIKKGEKLSDKEIESIIKGLLGLEITRNGQVAIVDGDEAEEEFEIRISSYKHDPKKDILKAVKFKG